MAQLQSTSITGSFLIGTIPNTGSEGNVWYNPSTGKLNYFGKQNPFAAAITYTEEYNRFTSEKAKHAILEKLKGRVSSNKKKQN